MSTFPITKRSQTTPAALYSEKYAWLMRWALHFCNKDRSAAEDLVQDVFMQMLVSWQSFQEADEPEKLLYTYLKFGFLLKCRKDRRYSFQNLSAIDFESLHLSLRRESFAHSLDVQDGLRRIVYYLNWRKQQAKAASVLLLRFFHGFFPSEIMQIAILTRRSVDAALAQAREEAKRHISDPSKMQIVFRGAPPAAPPSQPVMAPEAFVADLRKAVFDSGYGECMPEAVLRERYSGPSPRAIECDLLAHIVSCRRCLDLVTRWCKLPSLEDRLPEEAWGFAPKEKPASETVHALTGLKRGLNIADAGKRAAKKNEQSLFSMRGGTQRYLVAQEHRPKALLLAVDGQLIAARDISSTTSQLNIELTGSIPQELIEVMSDQELPLLTVPVLFKAGEGPPVIEHESTLTSGQRVRLLVRLVARGVLLEVEYFDPSFALAEAVEPDVCNLQSSAIEPAALTGPERLALEGVTSVHGTVTSVAGEQALPAPAKQPLQTLSMASPSRWALGHWFGMWTGLATCVVAVGAIATVRWISLPAVPTAHALLEHAANEGATTDASRDGVIMQRVRLHASNAPASEDINRQLTRDARGHRRPSATHPDGVQQNGAQQRMAARLAAADVSWDDPLSAANYRDWHDHARITKDVVARSANGDLVLTSFVGDNKLASESLTVRGTDFHPVARTIDFTDREEIQIAEVDYHVIPWSQADPRWFAADAAPVASASTIAAPILRRKAVTPPTSEQLDEAELGARVGLSDVKADGDGRVRMYRAADGIHIDGLVADEQRKRQIVTRLAQVPRTVVNVRTFGEFEQQAAHAGERPADTAAIVVAPQGVGESPLERLLVEQAKPEGEAGRLAHAFFANSVTLRQSAAALDELQGRFRSSALTPEAARLLRQLNDAQMARFRAGIEEQANVLHEAGVVVPSGTSRQAAVPQQPDETLAPVTLSAETAVHARLCAELVSQSVASMRAPQAILADMARSLLSLKTLAEQHDARQAQQDDMSAFGATAQTR